MKNRSLIRTLASAAICVAASFCLSSGAFAQDSGSVAFSGEIVDGDLQPISGVFPMTFRLYDVQAGGTPLWSETHFVAVYEGQYEVILGENVPVPAEHMGQQRFVAVELGGMGEVTRNGVQMAQYTEGADAAPTPTTLVYAHVSDHAVEADFADEAADCETLSGVGLDELNRYEEVLSEINTLRNDIEDQQQVHVGNRTVVLDLIGGDGGDPYSLSCPPGHVVTGIRGRHGALVDALELVCSPLE